SFGHLVTANWRQQNRGVAWSLDILTDDQGCGEATENGPRGIGRFWIVEWAFARSDFAPTGKAFAARFHQQNAAFPYPAEAGLKRRLETNMNFPKRKRIYSQELSPIARVCAYTGRAPGLCALANKFMRDLLCERHRSVD